MKRDLDLVRELLLDIEKNAKGVRADWTFSGEEHDPSLVLYHVRLLFDAGFVEGQFIEDAEAYWVDRITWQGHEFIDAVRDAGVWKKTKEAGLKVGGFGLEFAVGVAKSYVKQEIQSRLGISL
jgi:hypothetical protein